MHPHQPSLLVDCCVFAALSSAARNTNFFVTPSIPFGGWLSCLLCWEQAISSLPTNQYNWISHPLHCLLFILLIDCCDPTPPVIRVHKRVDCYVCELLLQLHPPPAHISCAQVGRGASLLVHSHQTILVVLMAESTASARSPATEEAPEGVGWL